MQDFRFYFSSAAVRNGSPLFVSFLALMVEALCLLGMSQSNQLVKTNPQLLSDFSNIFWIIVLFLFCSITIVACLFYVYWRHEKWLKSSRYAERFYAPKKSMFLIASGNALTLAFVIISAWKTPAWSLAFQATVWLLLCSTAFELSPGRISAFLQKASKYPRRSFKELVILAYSRRFGGAVIGLLCIEVGAWLIYLKIHETVANYYEALVAFFAITLAMYMLLYIPFCWGGIFLLTETKQRNHTCC